MKAASLLVLLAAALLTAGCSGGDTAPPADAMKPRQEEAPAKVPSTVDEKIKAIQNSGMPEAGKKDAIEKVKSGQL